MPPISAIQPANAASVTRKPEPGAEVRRQHEVDGAHQHRDADDDDEDAAELGSQLIASMASSHRLRTYWTIAWICSSVSMLPKPGMRPVP